MARSQKYGNETLDALNKGCLDLYDSIACGRISMLVLVSAITCFFIMMKIVKYHAYRHAQIHHYVILYVSVIQCFACATSSIFGMKYPQLDFTNSFLKLLQFILICHLHWAAAARSRHRDDIVQHVVNPVLCLYMLYCTTVVLMGMVDISGTWTECLRPYWLMLSSADFIAVQVFAIVALYLTHNNKHSAISTLMLPTMNSQTRDLWLVTAVYEVSAVVSVVFDAVMSFMGREVTGCSGIYNHVQIYYSSIIFLVMVVKYFLPTWTLLCVFQPSRVKSRPSEVALTSHYSMDGACYNQYRRMFFARNPDGHTPVPYPSIPYPTESPLYGSLGDFSYTDSSPDISPTVARLWPGIDDETCSGFEKHFINGDRINIETQHRMDQSCQNLERSLQMNINGDLDKKSIIKHKNLTPINEETSNVLDSPRD
ncbi:uncharacterized protein [Chelonus insularis]|uniref:uncharacterized protein n=1 Tax=Chelonus insularis TaxID=460826 RepID=UPI00158D98DD|nr:uncharacterized protein LOC118074663 [Chelonus insularis]XP_034951960.1 uncharacterized protein LOC118074663 [Chelonus insularis]XP_034951961.1 uncharacterized protein LOC118074663 [Chelonus insularis]